MATVNGFFFLAERPPALVERRLTKERLATDQWLFARRVTAILKHFPFVRAIFVSGELSKGVATESSDIDFLIITAANRLWLCRSFFPIFKRLLPKRYRRLLCFNTFITEDSLTFSEQTVYSAIELATLRPLYVTNDLGNRLFYENRWISTFLPNYPGSLGHSIPDRREPVGTPSLLSRILNGLDSVMMNVWEKLIRWKFSSYPDERRQELFVCTKKHATGYSHDHARRILNEYDRRLRELSLSTGSR